MIESFRVTNESNLKYAQFGLQQLSDIDSRDSLPISTTSVGIFIRIGRRLHNFNQTAIAPLSQANKNTNKLVRNYIVSFCYL